MDEGRPDQQGHHAAEGQEGSERDRCLAPLPDAVARHDRRPDEGRRDNAHHQGNPHLAAQEEPEHRGQLDVAHPHATRVSQREQE